jgi:hypothetical protein
MKSTAPGHSGESVTIRIDPPAASCQRRKRFQSVLGRDERPLEMDARDPGGGVGVAGTGARDGADARLDRVGGVGDDGGEIGGDPLAPEEARDLAGKVVRDGGGVEVEAAVAVQLEVDEPGADPGERQSPFARLHRGHAVALEGHRDRFPGADVAAGDHGENSTGAPSFAER